MVVNSDKFQAIILNRKKAHAKHIEENKTTNSIKLLAVNIDDQLKFNEHISILVLKQQCS